jgi:DNA-binding beta-propeller fold protein YncE
MKSFRWTLVRGILLVLLFPQTIGVEFAREKKTGKTDSANPDLVWPLPPDSPRIRYLHAHSGSLDYRKKPSRWKRFLLGPQQETGIQLVKPYGVTTDPEGRVYITDTGQGAVMVIDPEQSEVRMLGAEGQVRLVTPIGVALDRRSRIFVSDASLNQVFCFLPDGRIQMALGSEPGLQNPTGLAIDPERNRLYVADSHLHQIVLYSLDGTYLESWGGRGPGEGEFNYPTNLALDRNGRLLVVDTGNFRVQILSPEGEFVSTFGKAGDGLGDFHRPKGIALDSEGHIYISDAAYNNFQVFDAEGQLLLFVGNLGQQPGSFWLPAGVHIDGSDRIFVVDQVNARVQVFQYIPDDGKSGPNLRAKKEVVSRPE